MREMSSQLGIFAKRCALAVPMVVTFNDCFASVVTVDHTTMQPISNETVSTSRDRVLLDKFSVRLGRYKRGDVCYMKSPSKPNGWIVKRVIALEGDKVRTGDQGVVSIPQGFCWVEGDEADPSPDSHSLGPLPLGLIHGVVAYAIYPSLRRVPRDFPQDKVLLGYQHPWP